MAKTSHSDGRLRFAQKPNFTKLITNLENNDLIRCDKASGSTILKAGFWHFLEALLWVYANSLPLKDGIGVHVHEGFFVRVDELYHKLFPLGYCPYAKALAESDMTCARTNDILQLIKPDNYYPYSDIHKIIDFYLPREGDDRALEEAINGLFGIILSSYHPLRFVWPDTYIDHPVHFKSIFEFDLAASSNKDETLYFLFETTRGGFDDEESASWHLKQSFARHVFTEKLGCRVITVYVSVEHVTNWNKDLRSFLTNNNFHIWEILPKDSNLRDFNKTHLDIFVENLPKQFNDIFGDNGTWKKVFQ